MAVLEVNGLKKVYTTRFGGSRVQALTNVHLPWSAASMSPSWASPAPAKRRS